MENLYWGALNPSPGKRIAVDLGLQNVRSQWMLRGRDKRGWSYPHRRQDIHRNARVIHNWRQGWDPESDANPYSVRPEC